MVMSLHFAMSI